MLEIINHIPFESNCWPGKWIWAPGNRDNFEVVQFCKFFSKSDLKGPVRLHISADNRYKLYIDGIFLGLGPQRGDRHRWYFDTYDLSTMHLDNGIHVLSAFVWHDHDAAPTAQVSFRPGFLVAAEKPNDNILSTNSSWMYRRLENNYTVPVPEESYPARSGYDSMGYAFADLVPSEAEYEQEFKPSIEIGLKIPAKDYRAYYSDLPWLLYPRTIPALEAETKIIGICRSLEIKNADSKVVDAVRREIDELLIESCCLGQSKLKKIVLPSYSHWKFLIDHGSLTIGYPFLVVSNGFGSIINVTYQEALQYQPGNICDKGNRDVIDGKTILGIKDIFRPNGRSKVVFEPFWYRCWRYIEYDIQVAEQPIEIYMLNYRSTGYPMQLKAEIEANGWFTRLIEPGFRTLRLCSGETYLDCPYYEQLQYVGDTRIEALATYVLCDDDRLARQAIDAFYLSRLPNGLICGRYPCYDICDIPTFSLIYIAMLNDFLMWRGDIVFLQDKLSLVDSILKAFKGFAKNDGLIGKMPGWMFMDWVVGAEWVNGVPPGIKEGESFLLSFMYLWALQNARNLYQYMGKSTVAINSDIDRVAKSLRCKAYDSKRGLFVDDSSGKHLSQHTNILAILTDSYKGLIGGEELINRLLENKQLSKPSYYFMFFLFEAMHHVGRGDLIWPALQSWHDMLDNGLTTFAETPEPTRSDCHAWSVHPLFHFFASVLGIRPAAPGFSKVKITPIRSNYETVSNFPKKLVGSIFTPKGKIKVELKLVNQNWKVIKNLPKDAIELDIL